MKKAVITLCLGLLSVLSYAQKADFWQCHSLDECAELANNLLKGAKHEYQLDTLNSPVRFQDTYSFIYIEKNPIKKPLVLKMSFKYYLDGENKSLETKGTPAYRLMIIYGQYLDLFPIWQTWINPKADLQTLNNEKSDHINIGSESMFDRFFFEDQDNGYWTLQAFI